MAFEAEWIDDISDYGYRELLGGNAHDPVFQSVSMIEEFERAGIEVAVDMLPALSLLDWDTFAILSAGRAAKFRAQKRSENGGRFVAKRLDKKPCAFCGIEFKPRTEARKYCSEKCFHASHTKITIRTCACCGNEFKPARKSVKCCSKSCAMKLRNKKNANN